MTRDQIISISLLALAWAWILYRSRRRILDWVRVVLLAKAKAPVPPGLVFSDDDQDYLDPILAKWLTHHCQGAWRFMSKGQHCWIDFTDVEDSVLFKLTWS